MRLHPPALKPAPALSPRFAAVRSPRHPTRHPERLARLAVRAQSTHLRGKDAGVVIVGANAAGLIAALYLTQQQVPVRLLERRSRLLPAPAQQPPFLLTPGTQRLLGAVAKDLALEVMMHASSHPQRGISMHEEDLCVVLLSYLYSRYPDALDLRFASNVRGVSLAQGDSVRRLFIMESSGERYGKKRTLTTEGWILGADGRSSQVARCLHNKPCGQGIFLLGQALGPAASPGLRLQSALESGLLAARLISQLSYQGASVSRGAQRWAYAQYAAFNQERLQIMRHLAHPREGRLPAFLAAGLLEADVALRFGASLAPLFANEALPLAASLDVADIGHAQLFDSHDHDDLWPDLKGL